MATVRVTPLPDESNMRGKWQVKKGRRRVSNHLTKQKATQEARQEASSGDTLEIHGTDGQIQNRRTVR